MTTITALPTPPTRDDPINFADRADTFLAALPTFATEANTVASEINTKHNDVMSAEIIAYNVRGQWTTVTLYSQKDVYTDDGVSYLVVVLHTSTSISADLASGKVTIHQGITKSELATGSGSSLVGFDIGATGGETTTVQNLLKETISVKMFGATGDFNTSTFTGTDDRASIQAAFNYAISLQGGCKIILPRGKYYLGTTSPVYGSLGVCLSIGTTTAGSAKNIEIEGEGAEIYQGTAGRCLSIFGADRLSVKGLKIYGYTGGTLGTSRENDALISINYGSKNVVIEDNYLTNSLGDCIQVGGSLISGGELNYECRNITVRNNVLKERYGNGIRSYLSGTQSRLAIAVIDVCGLRIHDNVIYGSIDLEPNLDGQHLVDIQICDNQFKSGHVTAQSAIGSTFWIDESINLTGGSVIEQIVYTTGVAGSPIVARCVVKDNSFEYGIISEGNVYKFDSINGNTFTAGQIRCGAPTGSNYTPFSNISNNTAYSPLSGEVTFIRIDGQIAFGSFFGNRATNGFTYCINKNTGTTGDLGRSSFSNNTLDSGTSVIGFAIDPTSTEICSVKNGAGNRNPSKSSLQQSSLFYSPLAITSNYGAGSYTLDWNSYKASQIFVSHSTAGATVTITDIFNELGDGHELTIISGSFSGGNTVLVNGSGIFLKGGVNAILLSDASVTLFSRAGFWFEKNRSF